MGHWNRSSYILLVLATSLLRVTSVGCSCGQMFQEWLTQFLQDLTRGIELWIREQVVRFIAQLPQQIVDWWNGVVHNIQGWLAEVGRKIGDGWRGFWADVRPPAPVITEPLDRVTVDGANITVRGTARPGGQVTPYPNDAYFLTPGSGRGCAH